jgi:cell division protein FtsW (lipid II flippase)
MARKDLLSGAALLGLAAIYGGFAQRIPASGLDDPVGARGLPNVLAILLAVVALLIMAKAALTMRRAATRRETPSPQGGGESRAEPTNGDEEHRAPLPRALGFILIGVGYIVLAPLAGYAVAIALLIAAVGLYEGARGDWTLAAVAVGGGVAFWLIFVAGLGVEQPRSLFLGR